ncbi:GNAT family N-acetyltransferase, partial [Rhodanobacter sp. FW510-T8]
MHTNSGNYVLVSIVTVAKIIWKSSPDVEYRDWLSRTGALFADPLWVEPIVAALGAKALYGFCLERGEGVAVQVFRHGGLAVGYAGLPISPAWLSDVECRKQIIVPGVHLTRFNLSCLHTLNSLSRSEHAQEFAETVIPDLGLWPARNARKLKKDRAFAARGKMRVASLDSSQAGDVGLLYRDTVVRHKGSLRYQEDYFRAVIELSTQTVRVLARGAFDEAGCLAGFAIFGLDGSTAHYLHGGVADSARSHGVSDLLLSDAMDRVIELGAESVTLLPSPEKQPGLVAFKHKWGEVDGHWMTLDRSSGVLGEVLHLGMGVMSKLRGNAMPLR